jgi:hypothetical protein
LALWEFRVRLRLRRVRLLALPRGLGFGGCWGWPGIDGC